MKEKLVRWGRLRLVLIGFVGACLQFLVGPSPAQAAELVWVGDFEKGDFSQYIDKLLGGSSRSAKKIVKSPVRSGKYATELAITSTGKDGKERAELRSRLPNGSGIEFEWDGPEYWMGFSFLFKEWESTAWTFFQVHSPNEPKGSDCDFAGNTFSIWGSGAESNGGVSDKIAVRVIENGGVSRGKGAGSNNKVVYSYPFPINEWQDYVVNFKLSTKGKGFYKVWKNGKQIYSKSGLTNVNYRDSCGNLIPEKQRKHNGLHLGIYGPGDPGHRRIFYDEVRVAIGPDGYDLVAPDGSSKATAPPAPPEPPDESLPKPPVIVID